jgi:hypothetical protein
MTIKVDEHGLTVQASRPALSQTIAVGAGSVQSAPFSTGPTNTYAQGPVAGVPVTTPNNTTHIRCVSTSDCWIAFGSNPIAAASTSPCLLLPAGIPEYFWVYPGERVAVVQNAAAGLLNIAEMTA